MQNDFINQILADLNSKRALILEPIALTFSLTNPKEYLNYLRTLYSPAITQTLQQIELIDSETLSFEQEIVTNFLNILWLLIRISAIPIRYGRRHLQLFETLFLNNSILFNTKLQRHPADPRFPF
jgi:hypothetical protein